MRTRNEYWKSAFHIESSSILYVFSLDCYNEAGSNLLAVFSRLAEASFRAAKLLDESPPIIFTIGISCVIFSVDTTAALTILYFIPDKSKGKVGILNASKIRFLRFPVFFYSLSFSLSFDWLDELSARISEISTDSAGISH